MNNHIKITYVSICLFFISMNCNIMGDYVNAIVLLIGGYITLWQSKIYNGEAPKDEVGE